MRLTTRSEYGLICLKYLCEHSNGHPVSVTEIAEKENLPKDYLEQILVTLRRSGIIRSHKGTHGGFTLSRPPSEISIKEIFESLEGDIFEVFCSPQVREKIVCGHFSRCSVRPVWLKLAELIDQFCASVTLAALMQDEKNMREHLNGMSVQLQSVSEKAG